MKNYFSLVKISHTIFALPFALLGFFLATAHTGQSPDIKILLLIILCMVFARNAAMGFNRYIDRDIDLKNPRTVDREIPAGVISPRNALLFVIINCLLFVLTTFMINKICFFLSPIALAVILGYSYTKRFSAICHFILGLGLALAPIGAYLAVTGKFDLLPILYGVTVLFWVSGFDIIYALQDEEFDKSLSLKSIPVSLGRNGALRLSSILHLCAAFVMIYAAYLLSIEFSQLNWLHILGAVMFVGLLIYQHSIISVEDLSRINRSFFTTNGLASIVFSSLVIADFLF